MLDKLLNTPVYSLKKNEKRIALNECLTKLTKHHYNHCWQYQKILDSSGFKLKKSTNYDDLPFIPTRLFKQHELCSVDKNAIHKTMTSSGTTGQEVSKIFLDKNTMRQQQKALVKIVSHIMGTKRLPMLIIDSEAILKDRYLYSARGAGIMGFSTFSKDTQYALNSDMSLNIEKVRLFLEKHQGQKFFIFGFTFMIYQHLIQALIEKQLQLNCSNAVLIHGGGWKKLANQSISNIQFKKLLRDYLSINSVHDYYGMVEQTGSIYTECEYGNLHSPIFSDIIIRRPHDFSPAPINESGIIQTLSVLPHSYPGHSLMTEDEGVIIGEDDCKCGKFGKYFKVLGRLKSAEVRGCSDTYGESFA